MKIEINVENGVLNMLPKGENLSKEKIIEALILAYCSACKGYGVDFVECSSYPMGVVSDVYFNDEATLERIKKIIEPVEKTDRLEEK